MTQTKPRAVTFDAASATDIATMLHLVGALEEGLVTQVHVPRSLEIFSCSGPNFPWTESVRLTDPIGRTLEFLELGASFGERTCSGIDTSNPFAGLAILAMAVNDGRFLFAPSGDCARVVDSQLGASIKHFPDWVTVGTQEQYVRVGPEIGGYSLKETVGFALANQITPVIGDEYGLFQMARASASIKLGDARPARVIDPVIAQLEAIPNDLPWEDLYRFAQDRDFRKVTKELLKSSAHAPAADMRSDHELRVEGLSLAADLATGTHAAGIASFVFKCWRAWIDNRERAESSAKRWLRPG